MLEFTCLFAEKTILPRLLELSTALLAVYQRWISSKIHTPSKIVFKALSTVSSGISKSNGNLPQVKAVVKKRHVPVKS